MMQVSEERPCVALSERRTQQIVTDSCLHFISPGEMVWFYPLLRRVGGDRGNRCVAVTIRCYHFS